MKAISIALLIAFGCVCSVQADVWVVRSKPQRNVWAVTNSSESPNSSSTPVVKPSLTTGSDDALDEVNAYRAKKGLPPFKHDPLLTQAALTAAKTRANHLWAGHLQSDFACLPAGATADAAGCGALEDSWGWGTCLMDSTEYQVAGAAWVRGSDGKRYMHLFCRHGEAVAHTTKQTPEVARAEPTGEIVSSCANGSCGVGTVQQSSRLFGRWRR